MSDQPQPDHTPDEQAPPEQAPPLTEEEAAELAALREKDELNRRETARHNELTEKEQAALPPPPEMPAAAEAKQLYHDVVNVVEALVARIPSAHDLGAMLDRARNNIESAFKPKE